MALAVPDVHFTRAGAPEARVVSLRIVPVRAASACSCAYSSVPPDQPGGYGGKTLITISAPPNGTLPPCRYWSSADEQCGAEDEGRARLVHGLASGQGVVAGVGTEVAVGGVAVGWVRNAKLLITADRICSYAELFGSSAW